MIPLGFFWEEVVLDFFCNRKKFKFDRIFFKENLEVIVEESCLLYEHACDKWATNRRISDLLISKELMSGVVVSMEISRGGKHELCLSVSKRRQKLGKKAQQRLKRRFRNFALFVFDEDNFKHFNGEADLPICGIESSH